jgi:hypothetical protein
MRVLPVVAVLCLATPASSLRAQQPAPVSWSSLFAASGSAGTLPRRAASGLSGDCLPNRPDSLRLVPRNDSVVELPGIALLDARGRWRDAAATGADSLRARVVGAICAGHRGQRDWLTALVLEHDGAFLRYTPPAASAAPGTAGDRFPLLRMAWARAPVKLDYSPVLGWLGSAAILRDAGEWSADEIAAAREHRVLMGMHKWKVFVSLGRPLRSNFTAWGGLEGEEWTYPNGAVDFRENKVSATRLH